MNIVKVINRGLMLLFLLLSFNAIAEIASPTKVVELPRLGIKLSNDGTGILKHTCTGCDFKYLKITKNTKAEQNGFEVDIQQAKLRAGKRATIAYNPRTHEVQFIYWHDKRLTK